VTHFQHPLIYFNDLPIQIRIKASAAVDYKNFKIRKKWRAFLESLKKKLIKHSNLFLGYFFLETGFY
jgi:hypothetical protein